MLPRAEGRIELASPADKIDALCNLIAAGQQTLRLFSDELEPEIYDDTRLMDHFSALARRHRDSVVKVLIKSSRLLIKRRHHILLLQRRLPSLIQIRRLTHAPESHVENYAVVDAQGIYFDPRDDDKVCFANPADRPFARQLTLKFDELWQVSSADPELRALPL